VTYDLRARPLLVLLLLVVAAAGAALLVLERTRKSDSGSAAPAKPPVAAKAHSPARPAPKPKPKPARPASPADELPAPIRRALAADSVVVVSLYDPKAKIDGTAMREAEAGAARAGSSFVPIDVRKNNVAALNARYGVMQDPAVLVLRPPGALVVRIDGFADRETVAQAAVNAAS